MKQVPIGLLGCGTVGGGLVELIRRNREVVAHRTGVEIVVRCVLIRDPRKERPVPRELLTTDPDAVLGAKDVEIVVELIGGIDPAMRRQVGIADGLIRLSIGLEDVRDLIRDLEQALEKVKVSQPVSV